MSIRVNRGEFLQRLEAVVPGLSVKGILEQSASFVFREGMVITFNGEVACRAKSGLPDDFTGAVVAKPLLSMLHELPEDVLDISPTTDKFWVYGVGKRTAIRMDTKILLPISKVEKPEGWKKLPEDFGEAVAIVQECAGKDESKTAMTCLHIHPKWIEACDNYQLTRYRMKMPLDKPILVKRDSVKHVSALDMTKFCETKAWIHFRNPTGLVLSCLRYVNDFPDMAALLKDDDGRPTKLPPRLSDTAKRAAILSSEIKDENELLITLKHGQMFVRGVGTSGFHEECPKLPYDGPEMTFQISPKLLIEITKRHTECTVSPMRMMVNGGRWKYVTSLSRPKPKGNKAKKEEPQPEDEE